MSTTRKADQLQIATFGLVTRTRVGGQDRYASCGEVAGALRMAFGLPPYDPDHGRDPSRSSRPNTGSSSTPGTAESHTIIRTFTDPGTGIRKVNSVAFTPDGRTLATGDENGNAYLWDADTGRQTAVLRGGAKVFAVAFSPDAAMVATGYGNGSTYVWKAATGQLIDTIFDAGGKAVDSVAFSPDGKTLAAADENGSTSLSNVTGGL